jgi:ribonucleoside-diphosphate reductase beta chain
MSILNTKNVDTTSQPIFLGEPLSLQRFDRFKYYDFYKLYLDHQEQFWRPNEISLDKDRVDYESLTEDEKFIFTKNLQYQTVMDSVVARGAESFMEYVSIPEVEAYMKAWAFFETVHSESYTYIMRNVYSDPVKIMDQSLDDVEIMKRSNTIKEEYDRLDKFAGGDIKKQIYLSLVSVNILEAIRFYVSFVCTFAFAENKKMIGSADIVQAIRKDEAIHYRASQLLLNLLHNIPEEGFQDTVKECEEQAIQMYISAAEEEKAWADYLFDGRRMIGLSSDILKGYIEWLTDNRMSVIGFPKHFNTKNPIGGWYDKYMNTSNVESMPQEKELGSVYRIGATVNDLDSFKFEL